MNRQRCEEVARKTAEGAAESVFAKEKRLFELRVQRITDEIVLLGADIDSCKARVSELEKSGSCPR